MTRKLAKYLNPTLFVAGLGCLTGAAWTWYLSHVWPGLAATGVALIILEAVIGE